MELTGKVKLVSDVQTFDSGFTKREFVVTTNEQYPQDIKLEVIKDKCSLLDRVTPGSEVKVAFNLRGNEFNGKYFVNLQAWKIDAVDASSAQAAAASSGSGESLNGTLPPADDDLPF
ncbi:MAG: DUF3127 domain-containing protein [Bacteroidetes bacterium]|nr:DUF3127 domain-containing protein [Bacteroidota bacterium]HET6243494.1 DUF3127 domain-containing protein [Bacteroidia bacterium]